MTAWSQDVYSSNVARIAYDADKQEMLVTWKSGKTSVYAGVPEPLAQQVANAPSVGEAMNAEIKPYFEHRYA